MKDLKEWYEEREAKDAEAPHATNIEVEVEVKKDEDEGEKVELAVPGLVRALTVSNLITHLLNAGAIKPDGDMERLKEKLKVYISLLSKTVEEIE